MSIDKRIAELRPYVMGIRYVKDMPVVDVSIKEGWQVYQSDLIQYTASQKTPNYYMFFSDDKSVGFDELMNHVANVIKDNVEIEQKRDLLKAKITELQALFNEKSLEELSTLQFTFKENSIPELSKEEIDRIKGADKSEPPKKEELEKEPH